MNNIAIRVENLGKLYHIGRKQEKYKTLRDTIVDAFVLPFRKAGKLLQGHATGAAGLDEIIWALKDLSFEVKQGEVVGIIGRNGAGKSTLFKILSRITVPTEGYADIYGKPSALLEVGTGFHSELSGRENVYLNGAILGMKRNEIDRKFDEIVDFAEIEKFIDTPVKHYSSGMYTRLGFAVAAHLEPDILIVDEVLSVGDVEFQKKCMGKMSKVAKEGRTILFVSHNMGAITRLCHRTLWLEDGNLRLDGPSMEVVSRYISSGAQDAGYWSSSPTEDRSGRRALLNYAQVLSDNGSRESTVFRYDEQVRIEIGYEIMSTVRVFRIYLLLREPNGNIIWASHDTDGSDAVDEVREPGIYCSTCIFPDRLLRPGHYSVSVGIFGRPREAVEEEHLDIINFEISDAGYTFSRNPRMGLITPCLVWEVTGNCERQRAAAIRSVNQDTV